MTEQKGAYAHVSWAGLLRRQAPEQEAIPTDREIEAIRAQLTIATESQQSIAYYSSDHAARRAALQALNMIGGVGNE